MNADRGDRGQLAFFGTITAGLSHELKNVFATVNELAGLLGDLVAAGSGGRPLKPERLHAISEKINKQIGRGEVLIQRLNRFAHTADHARCTVDLGALLADLNDLLQRFARLKQVAVVCCPPQAAVELTTDPFAVQQAVFLAVRLAFAAADEGRQITVELDAAGPGCRIRVQSADPWRRPADDPDLALLERVAAALAAELTWEEHTRSVVLALPRG